MTVLTLTYVVVMVVDMFVLKLQVSLCFQIYQGTGEPDCYYVLLIFV